MVQPNSDEQLPILLAVSDNGPQMVSGTTREWMALHSLAWHTGRPGVPQDQAHIETLFGHVKGEWPELEQIRDPVELEAALEQRRLEYNTVRLHAGIGYVTPDDEHEGRGATIRKETTRGDARGTCGTHRLSSPAGTREPMKTRPAVAGSFNRLMLH